MARLGVAFASLPRYKPQLAVLVREPPDGPEWCHELKYDGYRMGLFVARGRVRIESRRELDWTARFPEIEHAAKALPVKAALIDGEAAIVLPDGRTSFKALANSFEGGSRDGLVYYAFDLLSLDGRDLTGEPLSVRKRELERIVGPMSASSVIRYAPHVVGRGHDVFAGARRLGAEGIVSKPLHGRYAPGKREGWRKVKCVQREELVIAGFTEPEGARKGIGALLLGRWDEGGELLFAGKVGTGPGFTESYLTEIRRGLDGLLQAECPFATLPSKELVGPRPRWVRPVLQGVVEYVERNEQGQLRHPSFHGFKK